MILFHSFSTFLLGICSVADKLCFICTVPLLEHQMEIIWFKVSHLCTKYHLWY